MPTPRMRTTTLPGIGVQYDLITREDHHVSVVAHRDGTRTLGVYRTDDPDACAEALYLCENEVTALIDALMPAHHSPTLLHSTDLGIVAERAELSAHSRWSGRLLSETRLRLLTGATVVAALRRTGAVPSPAPDFRLAGGDVLIVIGTRESVAAAADLLAQE
ncbi:TrkA C-terminal domain-containing protein [Streptomyces sp. NPDC048270]|uniref:cation:proton antiporter regulatory subunit n=1 Tax=Streptomyces sp. NPDC048270 TaxID=3154615 RepID=UPI0033DFEF13